jgi:hypothetical protein
VSFGDEMAEPARLHGDELCADLPPEPTNLVDQALGLVELMSATEYAAFVEALYGAGLPAGRWPSSRQSADVRPPAEVF